MSKIINICSKKIKINNSDLNKYSFLNKIIDKYDFIDMDPHIFNYILNVVQSINKLTQTHHHKKYNNTLVKLGILGTELYIKPKIILPLTEYNKPDKFMIYTINVRGKQYKTYKYILIKSPLLYREILNTNKNEIYIDQDYTIFNLVLNLMRNNETCYFPSKYINELNIYELKYINVEQRTTKIENNTKIHFLNDTFQNNNTTSLAGELQILSNESKIGTGDIHDILSNFNDYSYKTINQNDKIYSPSSSDQFFNINPCNSISIIYDENNNKQNVMDDDVIINFGKILAFNLSNNYGDMIDDILVQLDISKLLYGSFVNNLGNMIIKRIYINLNDSTIINFTGEYLDIYNKLYVKYENQNNDINDSNSRILIPIKISEKIPIRKENINLVLYIELQDKQKCIINYDDTIDISKIGGDLINVSLIVNYINLHNEKSKILENNNLYIYNNVKLITKNISPPTDNFNYCLTVVPLDSFNYIKDLIFVIHSYDDIKISNYFNYIDEIIDIELKIGDNTLFKLDKLMLNKYIPFKYFSKFPDSNGIYYYSFSANPKSNKLFGGLNIHFNEEHKITAHIRTNVFKGVIHIYSNNYHLEIL
jgi:hypothetical protein